MKSVKFLFIFILILMTISACTLGPDPITSCGHFKLNVRFENLTNNDITGDSVNLPYVKYDKDSIRYVVASIFDTTNMLIPTMTKIVYSNEYSLIYNFNRNIGLYKVIFYLNSIDKDSLIVSVNGSIQDSVKIYYNNSYLGSLGDQCQYSVTIKK